MSAENPAAPKSGENRLKTHWYHGLIAIGALCVATDIIWLISSNPDQNAGNAISFSSDSRASVELQPGAVLYTVKLGDTLSKIATDHGTDIIAIRDTNGLADVDLIYEGQELVIPPVTP